MNAYELFAAMDGIGDEILERSEIKRKSPRRYIRPSLIAACCVLILSVLYAQLRYGILHPTPQVDPTQETTEIPRQVVDTPYYNDARYEYPEYNEAAHYAMYELSHEEISAILPQPCPQWMEFVGEAMIEADGNVRTVVIGSLTSVENTEITIAFGQCDPGVRIQGEPTVYRCGQADFVMSQTEENDADPYWILTASAVIRSTQVYLEMHTPAEKLDAAKGVFEETLQWLGNGSEDSLNLQKLVPQTDPVIWTLPYSREQFELESGYGALLPEEDPQVYSDMEIVWKMHSSGVYEEVDAVCYQGKKPVLEWAVCFNLLMPGTYNERLSDRSTYTEAQELTLEAVERYVKESTTFLGQSIYHAVHYEKFTIYVCARDVSAQWLYDQLVRIRDMQKDYSVYLPAAQYSEDSKMFTQTVFHGGLLNEMCVSVSNDEKWILTWTVLDEELNQTTDNLIRAQDLAPGIMDAYISPQGFGYIQVYFDGVVVAIDSNGADVQWIYDQLIAVRERVGISGINYATYLPSEDSELWSETIVREQWYYESSPALTMQCLRKDQLVLNWSVCDPRLAEGTGPLIEAEELTLEMLEKCVEADGKIYADILFDDVWVSIDAQDIPAQWIYDQLIAVRERVGLNALNRFQEILHKPDLEGLCLKIYYMDPAVLTYAPLSAEDVKYAGKMIYVDTQTLLEQAGSLTNTELVGLLDSAFWKGAEELSGVNARMCCEFETGNGETVLQIVINSLHGPMFINGVQVEFDYRIYDVLCLFATRDLRDLWLLDQLRTGGVE